MVCRGAASLLFVYGVIMLLPLGVGVFVGEVLLLLVLSIYLLPL